MLTIILGYREHSSGVGYFENCIFQLVRQLKFSSTVRTDASQV